MVIKEILICFNLIITYLNAYYIHKLYYKNTLIIWYMNINSFKWSKKEMKINITIDL